MGLPRVDDVLRQVGVVIRPESAGEFTPPDRTNLHGVAIELVVAQRAVLQKNRYLVGSEEEMLFYGVRYT